MTTPKASGPLWAITPDGGEIFSNEVHCGPPGASDHPCRVIPGHGRVVPVELVEAILAAHDRDARIGGHPYLTEDAIDAAIRGAV